MNTTNIPAIGTTITNRASGLRFTVLAHRGSNELHGQYEGSRRKDGRVWYLAADWRQ